MSRWRGSGGSSRIVARHRWRWRRCVATGRCRRLQRGTDCFRRRFARGRSRRWGASRRWSPKRRWRDGPRGRAEGSARQDREVGGPERFFSQRAQDMSPGHRKTIIRSDHPNLSLSAQCRILKISRSSLYYRPEPVRDDALGPDEGNRPAVHGLPFFGRRQIVALSKCDGLSVGRHPLPGSGLQANHERGSGG